MEKIIILIVAIILSALWKKISKKAEDTKEPSMPGTPREPEIAPDAIPLPEAWGKMFPSQDIFKPIPVENPLEKHAQKQKNSKKQMPEKKQMNSSLSGTLGEHKFSTTEMNAAQPSPSHSNHEEPSATENDFTIHSAEEARRAIIWGEILQRKY